MMRRFKLHTIRKIKTPTPFSTKLGRGLIIASCAAIAIATPVQFNKSVSADQYDVQIAALQSQIDAENAQISQLSQQASSYQVAVQQLQAQVAVIQNQINLSQAQYNKLTNQIAQTKTQIATNKDALGQTLADLYVDGNTSTIEMLASSKNISDYLDKQQYQQSVRDQLTSTINQIQALQKQLTQQQNDAKVQLVNEQASQNALAQKQAEQQTLLNETQGQESAYQAQVAANQAQQKQLAAEQLAAMAATYRSTGGATILKSGVASSGGYPWNSSNCPMSGFYSTGGVDGAGNDGYGYGCRQCASYAAWRMNKETGVYPVNWGNAINFPDNARAAGYSVGYTPRPGSLAVMSASQAGTPYGHVAWVDAVSGNSVIVSQYNANYNGIGWGNYSQMEMSASAFTWYIYVS